MRQELPHKKSRAWLLRPGTNIDIGELLDSANGEMPLAERHLWLVQLMDWIRAGEPVSGVQYVMRDIRQHPERHEKVLALLAAFWRDIDVGALLADFGFTNRSAFTHELLERLRHRTLPHTPATKDLSQLFSLLFDGADDAHWLAQLDSDLLSQLSDLLSESLSGTTNSPLGWRDPFYDAIMFLSSQVRAAGFSHDIRMRMGMRVDQDFGADAHEADRHSQASAQKAFRQLVLVSERMRELALAAASPEFTPEREAAQADLLREAQYLRALLDTCVKGVNSIHKDLEAHGVSINLVYQIDQLIERCRRIEQLLSCVLVPDPAPEVHALVVSLVQASVDRRSIRALFRQHYSLLARKVAERSAETGQHYITRTRAEYADMFWRAAGGGAVMSITTLLKFALLGLGLSPFWSGFAAGMNYSVSFVLIQLGHMTVATKQPAMTAPAMAARLADTNSDEALDGFVDEVTHLIRSQVAGILGNLLLVAPCVLLLQLLCWLALGRPLIDAESADHVLDSLTLWGPSLWYAAVTGVLLFISSMFAGWLENWFVLNKLGSALRWNPRIRATFGAERAEHWGLWWRANISGVGANVSLGMMLGLVPVIAGFFALPLDVRHVTLSTGQLAAALGTLGMDAVHDSRFWWGVAALPLTAMLNVGVSFACALRVAIRSRGVRVKDRQRLQSAMWRRLRQKPLSFLMPPR